MCLASKEPGLAAAVSTLLAAAPLGPGLCHPLLERGGVGNLRHFKMSTVHFVLTHEASFLNENYRTMSNGSILRYYNYA